VNFNVLFQILASSSISGMVLADKNRFPNILINECLLEYYKIHDQVAQELNCEVLFDIST
jgi:hypothetical protein